MQPQEIIFIYCVCDDLVTMLGLPKARRCKMTQAEVMTVVLVAAKFFGGRWGVAQRYLKGHGYFPQMLSPSQLNRRALMIDADIWEGALNIIGEFLSTHRYADQFVVDSFPVQACQPCRSWRCKLFRGKEYLGYCASKKLHYYGLKAHLIVTVDGDIVELFLTPASTADITALDLARVDLPAGSKVYADRAYTKYALEDELKSLAGISLIPQRKTNSRRQHSKPMQYLQSVFRKRVETSISQICHLMPRYVAARSAKGFCLRIFLFGLAHSVHQLQDLRGAAA